MKDPAWELVKPEDKFPPLYSQENVQDPVVQAKFFNPVGSWTWYAIEYDGKDTFFGLVDGSEVELGYFYKSELESTRFALTLNGYVIGEVHIERDLYFTPKPLSQVRREIRDRRGE